MIDYGDFATRLISRKDRWSLLAEYVREWNLPIEGKSRYSDKDVEEAEARLGFKLPISLREWYQLPFQPYQLTKNYVTWHYMIGPNELDVTDGLVVFHAENQYCCEWAFRIGDAHLIDPPVYIGTTQEDMALEDWAFQNETLSEFVLQMVIRETIGVRGYESHAEKVDESVIAQLKQNFNLMGFPDWLELGSRSQFFGGSDVILITWDDWPTEGEVSVTLGARSLEGRNHALDKLDVEWEWINDSGEYSR